MTHHAVDSFPPEDLDQGVGLVFRRLSAIRAEFGEGPALDRAVRAVRAVLLALGRAAHDESERRARVVHYRYAPPAGPFGSTRRRVPGHRPRVLPGREKGCSLRQAL